LSKNFEILIPALRRKRSPIKTNLKNSVKQVFIVFFYVLKNKLSFRATAP